MSSERVRRIDELHQETLRDFNAYATSEDIEVWARIRGEGVTMAAFTHQLRMRAGATVTREQLRDRVIPRIMAGEKVTALAYAFANDLRVLGLLFGENPVRRFRAFLRSDVYPMMDQADIPIRNQLGRATGGIRNGNKSSKAAGSKAPPSTARRD